MSEELEVLKDVSGRLEKANIPYMVTGSIAANLYAVPRMTRDVDIIIQIKKEDAARLVEIFKKDFYIDSESVLEAIDERGMFNIIHNQYVFKVDFIIRKDSPYRELEFQRRRCIKTLGFPLWVVTPEDLVLSKLVWAKESRSGDTSPEIEEKMREMIRKKMPEERLRMGCSMYDFSKSLVTHALLEARPRLSPAELRQELFLRFYGNDFDPVKREKILRWFSK